MGAAIDYHSFEIGNEMRSQLENDSDISHSNEQRRFGIGY